MARMRGEDFGVNFAALDELDGRQDEAFLKDLAGEGHGAGAHAADVGVVGSVGDEEGGFGVGWLEEDGGDERDVGQVGAAAEGVVEDDGVAGLHADVLDGGADGEGHCAEVDREVVALRDGVGRRRRRGRRSNPGAP